jgi:hypothetical protein
MRANIVYHRLRRFSSIQVVVSMGHSRLRIGDWPLALVLVCGPVTSSCTGDKSATPGAVPAERQSSLESRREAPAHGDSAPGRARSRPGNDPPAEDLVNVLYVDVARERGLIYVWPDQPRPMTALDAFGSGCAAFDGDNDGWQDVLLVGDPAPALFRNLGDGRFDDVTGGSGLTAVNGDWTGCAIGDYDGDGLLDVLLTGYHQLALYKNLGGMRFRDVTATAGLDLSNHGNWGASAGFMDLDGDQWLDLVVLNYVVYGPESKRYCEFAPGVRSGCGPKTYPSERGRIFRNTGAAGFELVPDSHGMADTHGTALVLGFIDLDDDGRLDFYIGNDGLPADLMHNQGNMHFKNISYAAGVALNLNASAVSAMTADWADFDRDGRLDLIVTNWQNASSVIFRGLGDKQFTDCSKRTNLPWLTKNRMGFGGKWVDFENDAWPDIFIVNGHVYDNVGEFEPGAQFRQPLQLLSNRNARRFVDLVPKMGPDVRRGLLGRGSATADFNNDGFIDLLAVDFEGPVALLENRTTSKKHWLKLDLRGAPPNIFAYGARVVGRAGDARWIAEVSPASSYLSSSDPRIHWGLGDVSRLESLTIRWPSGGEETLLDVDADQILRVVQDRFAR